MIAVPALKMAAQTIRPYQAQQIEVYKGRDLAKEEQDAKRKQQQNNKQQPAPPSTNTAFFQRTFGLAIPGVAYTVDNTAANTRTLVTSAGAITKSSVRINPDHTYDWNSDWDRRMIHGKWVEQKDGILLLKGQEHRDWLMRAIDRPSGKAVVTLWDQNAIWYNGTPLK
jgi:hypothetical protein